jgi:glycosyltransferase involved in cell wall biosynthesis
MKKYRSLKLRITTNVPKTRSSKKLTRFDSRVRPDLDLFAGKITFLIVLIYVVLYRIYQGPNILLSGFHWYYASLLLPIWLVDGFKSFFEVFLTGHYKSGVEELDKVTVVIACKNGEDVVGITLDSLLKRFNKDQVIVVSNDSTDNTCDIVRSKGVICLEVRKPLGKVRAINYGLKYVKTPYVLLLDDDTLVGRANIPTSLLAQGYGGVAFRVLVKTSTWITKFQAYEYRKTTDIGKRFHNKKASVQNISGAIGLFTLPELTRQIKLHNGEFSGEDLQRTLLIYLSSTSKGVVLTHATVYTLPPTTLSSLFKQRVYGWFPGLYASFPKYVRIMFSRKAPPALRVDAFYNSVLVMIFDVLRLLSLPILIFYPWYFLIMYCSYLLLEYTAYYLSGMDDPLWIVLLYPFYGLFGFATRICAFMVLMYRRLAATLGRSVYFDDYKGVSKAIKLASAFMVIVLLAACLLANDRYGYANLLVSYHL